MKNVFLGVSLVVSATVFSQKFESVNDSLFSVANEFRNQEKYQESNEVLKKISLYSSAGSKALFGVIRNFYIEKKYDEAISRLKTVDVSLLNKEELHEYYLLYTNILDDADKPSEALVLFNEGVKLFPESYLMYYNRSIAHIRLKNRQAAVDDLFKSIEIYPNYFRAHYLLGTIAIENGNLAEGILAITTSILHDTDNRITPTAVKYLNYELAKKFEEPKEKVVFEGSEQFSNINNIIKKQFALSKGYKVETDLDITYIRQLQATLSELSKIQGSKGFFAQRYLEFYKRLRQSNQFETFSYRLFQNYDAPDIQKIMQKKKGELQKFNEWLFNNIVETVSTRRMNIKGKEELVSVVSESDYIGYGKYANGVKEGPWVFNYSNGYLFLETAYEKGINEGVLTFYHTNGKLMRRATFKAGKLNGKSEYFNILGYPTAEKNFENDNEINLQQFFFPLGGKKSSYFVKNNKIDGKEEFFYENGNPKSVTHYVLGDLQGEHKEFYVDGTLRRTVNYQKNKAEGERIEYYHNKNIFTKETFVGGDLVGASLKNYASGDLYSMFSVTKGKTDYAKTMDAKVLDEERFFEGNRLVKQNIFFNNKKVVEYTFEGKDGFEHIASYKTFDENGAMVAEKKLKTNTPFEIVLANGNKCLAGNYNSKGEKDGEFKYYSLLTGLLTSRTFYEKNVQTKLNEEYYPSGAVQTSYEMKDGKKHGKYTSYYRNGKVASECHYINDNLEGDNIRYHKNGNIKDIAYYEKDEVNGGIIERFTFSGKKMQREHFLGDTHYKTVYYKDDKEKEVLEFTKSGPISYSSIGQVEKVETTLRNGCFEGNYLVKDTKNRKIFEAKMMNGQRFGEAIRYNPDGSILSISNNSEGQLYGAYTKNNLDGKLYWKSNYINDKEFGTLQKYHAEGLNYCTTEYFNDEKSGKEIYYGSKGEVLLTLNFMNGKVFSYQLPNEKEIQAKNGALNLVVNSKETNKPILEVNFLNGENHGPLKYYHPSGQLLIHHDYTKGELDKKQWFYTTGKPYMIEEYKDNDNNGKAIYYHPNGKLNIEANYANDGLHGTYKQYDANGTLIINNEYEEDVLVQIK